MPLTTLLSSTLGTPCDKGKCGEIRAICSRLKRNTSQLPNRASVIIIGGGIQGLALAFNMAEQGQRDVLVIDAGWSYGFAGAPAAGKLLADAILKGRVDRRMVPVALDRFEKTGPIAEGSIVLA